MAPTLTVMRVSTKNQAIEGQLHRMAALVVEGGGFVADDFTVHERDGFLWASIGDQIGVPGRLLVRYPRSVTVPFDDLQWTQDWEALELAEEPQGLTPLQRELLDSWLSIINEGRKMRALRQQLPQYTLSNEGMRKHLADGQFLEMTAPETPEPLRTAICRMHSLVDKSAAESDSQRPATRLIPLKAFVNHAPHGAAQHGRGFGQDVIVQTSRTSNSHETFEDYGDLDALQTAVQLGFVCAEAQVVHMVPTQIEDPVLGTVEVAHMVSRKVAPRRRDIPAIELKEGGLTLNVMTARPDNYARVREILGMPYQSRGLDRIQAIQAAEALMRRVAQVSRDYLAELERLGRSAQLNGDRSAVVENLIQAADLQVRSLETWWLEPVAAGS